MRVSGSKTLQRLLEDNELDFTLMEDAISDQNLQVIPFYQDRLVVVTAAQHPFVCRGQLCFTDIAGADFLLREPGSGVRDKFDHLMYLRNIRIGPLWESADTAVIIRAVKANLGIAILLSLLVGEQIAVGELSELPISDLPLERNLNIVHLRSRILSQAAQQLLVLLQEAAQSL